jgi:hypothetical protein
MSVYTHASVLNSFFLYGSFLLKSFLSYWSLLLNSFLLYEA